MTEFPRTEVEGVSLPRTLIGINWFLGFSHQTQAKSKFIQDYQTASRVADTMEVFVRAGVDCVYGVAHDRTLLLDAIKETEDRTGRGIKTVALVTIDTGDTQEAIDANARLMDEQAKIGATFFLPHQCSTDALLDVRARRIRHMDRYCQMIRERGMLPGLSTHTPEAVIYADETDLDVATYIQIYNAAGFLMHVEVDWIHRVIQNAKKPVMVIKPMAAGRLHPLVGMAFVWATIRPQDMVVVGTLTPDEAKELVELSLSFLENRQASIELQATRSKASMAKKAD
jgi:hypothetical protein